MIELSKLLTRVNSIYDIEPTMWDKLYQYPFSKKLTLHKTILLGLPFFALKWFHYNLWPFPSHGKFKIRDILNDEISHVKYNSKNPQFQSLYGFTDEGYERSVCALIDILSDDRTTLFDVGSNWGGISLHLVTKPHFKGKIYCFEPNEKSYRDSLKIFRQLHHFPCEIHILNKACSNMEGQLKLNTPMGFLSGGSNIQNKKGSTRVTRLSNYFEADYNIDYKNTIIKIDTEGHELEVFDGFLYDAYNKSNRPWIIFENIFNDNFYGRELLVLARLVSEEYTIFECGFEMLSRFFFPDDIAKSYSKVFSIKEYDIRRRPQDRQHKNFLAVHKSRIEELKKKFTDQ